MQIPLVFGKGPRDTARTREVPRSLTMTAAPLEKGPSPIRVHVMEEWLRSYPRQEDAKYLLKGFKYGFRIPAVEERKAFMAQNLRSVLGMECIVQQKIDKEVREGRVLGPFSKPPMENLRVSPLGIVPKKAPGEFRLIHHLSFPEGGSVKDAIPQDLCTVRYTSFDEAVKMIRKCGLGAELAKCYIKSAFRLLPDHPHDFNLLGFQFGGAFYVDRAYPWDARCRVPLSRSSAHLLNGDLDTW